MAKKITKPGRSVLAAPGRLVFERDGRAVWQGDCLAWLAAREPGRFSACVTDPPYELGFMGRKWDKSGVSFDPETWRAVLRALRPGAHLVAFGGTRTFYRIACAIEDAGWEMRDCLMWVYGSGFPKSLDVSKTIDADACRAELTERLGRAPTKEEFKTAWKTFRKVVDSTQGNTYGTDEYEGGWGKEQGKQIDVTAPTTPEAARWQGWGTGLKPSWEPIILARKPLDSTVAECVLRHGTGALNVDGCRIRSTENPTAKRRTYGYTTNTEKAVDSEARGALRDRSDPIAKAAPHPSDNLGRWPPNAVFQHDARCVWVGKVDAKGVQRAAGSLGFGSGRQDGYEKGVGRVYRPDETRDLYACVPGCPVRMLDGQSGQTRSQKHSGDGKLLDTRGQGWGFKRMPGGFDDSGGASRFFYTPKASTAERRAGLSILEDNAHPTVKPVALMEWLLRLIAPPGGEVLDPFAGSGSTLVAAKRLGIAAVGIDLDAETCETAAARLTRRTAKGLSGTKKLKLGKRRRRK